MLKKKIPFNIVFAFLFLGCLSTNFICKTYTYIVSTKYEGKIIDFSGPYTTIYPIIEILDENNNKQILKNEEWFYFFQDDQLKWYEKDLNKRVTVLYNESRGRYEYVTFLNYWITIRDLLIWFCVLFFGVIFIEIFQIVIFRD